MQKQLEKMNIKLIIRVVALMLLDMVGCVAMQYLALLLRYELNMTEMLLSGFVQSVTRFSILSVLILWGMYLFAGNYRSLWQFMSAEEGVRIVLATLAAALLQYVTMLMFRMNVPRSFPVMYPVFMSGYAICIRLSYRFVRKLEKRADAAETLIPTLLIGAGSAGEQVQRALQAGTAGNKVVCVIDDDKAKKGFRLLGAPIIGGRECIRDAAVKYGIKEIILAIPTLQSSDRRAILKLCQETGLPTRIMPSIEDVVNGKVSMNKLRKVQIEDLLGRDSVHVDNAQLTEQVEGKTVLVTGGGGSIGSEICRQIAMRNPKRLIIFDIYENNAYSIQMELMHSYPELQLETLIGSVRDVRRVEQIFDRFRPDIIYHAAAHKHVPLMEDSPAEAIKNNVFGTLNVAQLAYKYGAQVMVLISSDKAVNPTNVMGASKRICEMIVQMMAHKTNTTRYVAVRFGNVLGSNGSVIPLFRRQIEYGGPVTVTSKEIIRYFMTIPEAVSLVMQAGCYAKGGEVFVLDMGSPVRIDDLARNMIRLSGLEPDVDIRIEYTGLRPGEKQFEELLMAEEGLEKTANELIYVGHPNGFSDKELLESLNRLWESGTNNREYDVVEEMKHLVKTFDHHTNR